MDSDLMVWCVEVWKVSNIAVSQSSEEYYRQAVKTVNEEILKYQNVYPDASKEQLFAAIAIENVFKNQMLSIKSSTNYQTNNFCGY